MRTMRQTSLILLVFSIAALLRTPAFLAHAGAQSDLDIVEISKENAAKFIRQDKGRVILVLVYASWCPSCQKFFPEFLQLAGRLDPEVVDVLAFSVDDTKEDIAEYLSGYQLTIVPIWLQPGPQGGLAEAMATAGIVYDGYIPFVAVLDKQGRVVYQGRASIQALIEAIDIAQKH